MKATDTAILGHLATNDTLYLSAVASGNTLLGLVNTLNAFISLVS